MEMWILNIAILHSGDLNKISPGGVSQYIEKIIKYNKKNDITLFGVVDEKSEYVIGKEYTSEIEGKKYKFIPIQNNKKKPLSIYYFFNIFKLFNKLKEFDVIYAQRMEYALPFTFSKLRGKLIMAVHGSGKYSYIFWGKIVGTLYNILERISIRNCSKAIVLLKREEYGVPYYKNRYSKHSNKIIYGKVPIDLNLFKRLNKEEIRFKYGINQNDKILIYFGRIDNNPKRVLLLPKIIDKLSKKMENVKCIIIGDGEDKSKLISMCNELNLEDRFIFYNKIGHGKMLTELVNLADLSIILSTFEGICMSALESIACCVPVIATDVGDVNEYIYNSTNGIIMKSSDDTAIVEEAYSKILDYFTGNEVISIDNVYKEYSGDTVMNELNNIFYEVSRVG